MKRMFSTVVAVVLVVFACAAPVAAAAPPDRAHGELWLTDAIRGDAYCIFDAHEAAGIPGTPGYVPAGGYLRLVTATSDHTYTLDSVSISGNQAFLFDDDPYARLVARAVDGGGRSKDTFGCGSSAMSITAWTVVSGGLVVRSR